MSGLRSLVFEGRSLVEAIQEHGTPGRVGPLVVSGMLSEQPGRRADADGLQHCGHARSDILEICDRVGHKAAP